MAYLPVGKQEDRSFVARNLSGAMAAFLGFILVVLTPPLTPGVRFWLGFVNMMVYVLASWSVFALVWAHRELYQVRQLARHNIISDREVYRLLHVRALELDDLCKKQITVQSGGWLGGDIPSVPDRRVGDDESYGEALARERLLKTQSLRERITEAKAKFWNLAHALAHFGYPVHDSWKAYLAPYQGRED